MRTDHLPYLDGWRGLAMLCVLVEHFLRPRGLPLGMLGVNMFFALSGLLMSTILYERRVSLGQFFRRRFARILPVFVVFVPVAFSIAAIMGSDFDAADVAATMTFLRTYLPDGSPMWGMEAPVQHIWSLSVEEHSYILLAALTLIVGLRGREWLALGAISLASLLITVWYIEHPQTAPQEYQLRTEVACIYIMLSAGYRTIAHRVRPYVRPWMPVVATVAAAVCYVKFVPVPWFARALAPPFLLAFAINHIDQARFAVRALSWKPITMIGIWSYSIYLWQQPVSIYGHHLPPMVSVPLVFAVALASFYWLEMPARNWLNNLGKQRTMVATGDAR